MKELLATYLQEQALAQPGQTILVACSGGADSVVLAHLLLANGYNIALAHMNFGLRGADADEDQQLVEQLANRWHIPCFTRLVDTKQFAQQHRQSIQVAARNLRYEWLQELAATHRYAHIATGHHANDNLETAIHHLIRGTGISGMRGMLPRQGMRISPLLWATKAQIVAYAREQHLPWREDASNQEDYYLRNRIRHHVLPPMEAIQPAVIESSVDTLSHLRLAEQLYLERLEQYRKKLLRPVGREYHIPLRRLQSYPMPALLLYALLPNLGFTIAAINDILTATDSGKVVYGDGHRLIRHRHTLILATAAPGEATFQFADENTRRVLLPNGILYLSTESWNPHKTIPTSARIAAVDVQTITWPFVIRPWQKGDYFYPLGLTKRHSDKPGKKKVSDLFQSLKLSLTEKEQSWIVLSGDRIVWVAPYRMDERHKVSARTREVLLLRWEPK